MKEVFWVGSSRESLRAFPEDARRRAGYQLRLLQEGLEPHDHRSMPTVGAGVHELRIHTAVEHRVLYVAKFSEAIYVLHAFQKKERRTSKRDLDLAQVRYQELKSWRASKDDRLRGGQ
jgi:phage-related protein